MNSDLDLSPFCSVYYWREIREFITGDRTPTIDEVRYEITHRKVWEGKIPVPEGGSFQEHFFYVFNMDNMNPLATKAGQRHLKELMRHPHTSMSVGDVIRVHYGYGLEDDYWICRGIGFEQMS